MRKKEKSLLPCNRLGDVHDLNGLQHVGKSNNEVARFDHAPGLEEGESFVEVALHIVGEAETEGYQAPLQIETPPHRYGCCKSEDWAVGAATRKQGRHVSRLCVDEKGVNLQIVRCNNHKNNIQNI